MPYIIIGVIIIVLIIIAVLYYFTKTNFTNGGGVYSIEHVLRDRPDLLKKIEDGRNKMRNTPYEDMEITSFDGLKLVGQFYRAEKDMGRYLICMHGYRSSPEDFMCALGQFLSLGYNVLLVNQRAHGKSEGKWITFGVKERRDCISWCNHLIKTFGNDIKVVFDGLSMGATTVLMAASEPDIPKNVVGIMADCGFSSPFDIIAHVAKKDMHIPKFPLLYLMIPAVKFWAGFSLTKYSTIKSVKKTSLPILFIHGQDDDFVPCDMSVAAYNARPQNSILFTVPGAKHGLSYLIDEEGCSKACEDFLLSVVSDNKSNE